MWEALHSVSSPMYCQKEALGEMSLFAVVFALEEVVLKSAGAPRFDFLSISPLKAGGHFGDLILRSVSQSCLCPC